MSSFVSGKLARLALALIAVCGSFGLGQCNLAAAADDDVAGALKLVPNEALGAAVVGKLSGLDEKLNKAAAAIGQRFPGSHLETAKQILGIQEGLDDSRAAVAVVLPPVSEENTLPIAALAVPVTDYEKFIANFSTAELEDGFSRVFAIPAGQEGVAAGQSVWAIKRDKFAIVIFPFGHGAESDEAQVETRKKLKKLLVDRKAEMSPEIGKAKDWLAKQDIGAVMTEAGVKVSMKAAGEGLKQMRAFFDQFAQMRVGQNEAQADLIRQQMRMTRSAFDLYESLFAWIEKEVGQLAVGVRVDEDSTVRLASRASFLAADKWKDYAAKLPAAGGKPFAGMPGGEYVAAFEGLFPGSGSNFLTDYTVQMLKMMGTGDESKLTDDDWKRLGESIAKSMEGVRSMSIVMGVPTAGQSLYGAMSGVVKVEDSAKYLDNYAESIKALGEVSQRVTLPYFGKFETKKIELDGSPALEVVMDYSGMIETMEKQPGGAAVRPMMELMLGKGGKIGVYLQPIDKNTVAMAWVDKAGLDRAKEALKSPAAGMAADAGANATVAMLPKGSQWVVLVSPSGIVAMVKSFMQQITGQAEGLPDFGDLPPVGLGARLEGSSLDMEFVVPGKTIEGAVKAAHEARNQF